MFSVVGDRLLGAVKLMRSTIRSTGRCWRPPRRGHAQQNLEEELRGNVDASTLGLEVSRAAEGSGDGNNAAEALEEAASRAHLAREWAEEAGADVGAAQAAAAAAAGDAYRAFGD